MKSLLLGICLLCGNAAFAAEPAPVFTSSTVAPSGVLLLKAATGYFSLKEIEKKSAVERAAAAGLDVVDLSIATNEQHGRDNANMGVEEGAAQAEAMLDRAAQLGLRAQLGLQTVWGYEESGDTPLALITELARRFAGRGLESFSLADSTGLAHPGAICRVVDAVAPLMDAPLVLHLHDTRGLGVANILAAAGAGVCRFDTSLGGLGGCPFIPGATGNVATEDVVWALEASGYHTGVDMRAVASVTREVADFLGRKLPGKLYGLIY